MAAITATPARLGNSQLVRSASLQGGTGQTDWLWVPPRANHCRVIWNLTFSDGSVPTITPSFLAADPISQDDSYIVTIAEHAAFAGITSFSHYVFDIGPSVSGIANDTTIADGAPSQGALNAVLPALLGIKLLHNQTGDERYSYKLSVVFRA